MEKKIERVPYISKWYKWEEDCSGEHFRLDVERTNQYLKNELLHFNFKDEPMSEETAKELNNCFKNTHIYFDAGSDFDVDKFSLYDKNLYTYSTNTTNGLWTTGYSKPTVQLKYVCNLTQEDVEYLKELLHLTNLDVKAIKNVPSREKAALDRLLIITNYIRNAFGVRDKAHEKQLEDLIEQSKPKKSYEGTLGEHWKELMDLFDVKDCFGKSWKDVFIKGIGFCKDNEKKCSSLYETFYEKIKSVADKLGIDFIKDFIKACEKCEE